MWGNQDGFGDQTGGFMNSGTPQDSSKKAPQNKRRIQNVIHCSVAQIHAAEVDEEKFIVNGVEIGQVILVGLVRAVDERPTRIDYDIDDMTGPPLKIKTFVDDDEKTPDDLKTIVHKENTYVKVHGHIRFFQNQKSLVGFEVEPLTDMNELTNHILEVMNAHMHHGSHGKSLNSGDGGNVSAATPAPSFMQQQDQGLTPEQAQVYEIIRQCIDEKGISVRTISETLRGLPQESIKKAIEFLSGEGHVYSTIDDDHFRATDS